MNFHFPRISPTGWWVAGGHGEVWVRHWIAGARFVARGLQPVWLDSRTILFSDGAGGSATRLWTASAPDFVPQVVETLLPREPNALAAGGGRWAAWSAGYGTWVSDWPAGLVDPRAYAPEMDQGGRIIHLWHPASAKQEVYLAPPVGASTLLDSGYPVVDPRLSLTAAVWSRFMGPSPLQRETWGRYRPPNAVRLQVREGDPEFHPVAIDTAAGPWALSHTQTRILLRPFEQPEPGRVLGHVVWEGDLGYELRLDGLASDDGFIVVWNTERGDLVARLVRRTEPVVELR